MAEERQCHQVRDRQRRWPGVTAAAQESRQASRHREAERDPAGREDRAQPGIDGELEQRRVREQAVNLRLIFMITGRQRAYSTVLDP